jgi:serine/threonine protein kinase
MLATNEVLRQDRYRIIHHFGEDMTGAVYEAYDNVLGTNVMLKEIVVNLEKVVTAAQLETRNQAFASQAKVLTEINHESLLNIYDYFSEIDRQYLVMESIGGQTLHELMEKDKSPIALSVVTNWAEQLLDALHCLHTRHPQIIHGDVKPQNIKLTSTGKIKLLALGIAKNQDSKTNPPVKNQSAFVAPHYLPLEQIWSGLDQTSRKVILNSYDESSEKILEQPLDVRSDIYSLGATLYHLLTARLPIDALERSIDILEGKADPLPKPNEINSKIPSEISDVLMTALEIRREHRFSSAVIMRQILRTAILKVREREAEESRKPEKSTQEIKSAEQKTPEAERRSGEQERIEKELKIVAEKKPEAEAEQKRQLELIQQQLREAEAQRLKAEERAAAAEKLLREKEAGKSSDEDIIKLNDSDVLEIGNDELLELSNKEVIEVTEAHVHTSEPLIEVQAIEVLPAAENSLPEPVNQNFTPENSDDEYKELFVQPASDNRIFKRMLAAVVCLLALGGAGWGIWSFSSSQPTEPKQTISVQPDASSEAAKPEKVAESSPAPVVQTTPEAETTSSSQAVVDTTVNSTDSTVVEDNSVSTPASIKAKRKTPPPVKPQSAQKKAVTVDDIIRDN